MRKRGREIPLARVAESETVGRGLRACEHPSCEQAGEYRAPRKRGENGGFYWFCLDHVRAYNASWDYFRGMSEAEIERFRRDAVIGHRPTWRLGSGPGTAMGRLPRDPFGFFARGGAEPGEDDRNGVSAARLRALAMLDLEPSVDLQQIKMRYKQLVKRFHPDATGGDTSAEERFKSINEAYNFLVSDGVS